MWQYSIMKFIIASKPWFPNSCTSIVTNFKQKVPLVTYRRNKENGTFVRVMLSWCCKGYTPHCRETYCAFFVTTTKTNDSKKIYMVFPFQIIWRGFSFLLFLSFAKKRLVHAPWRMEQSKEQRVIKYYKGYIQYVEIYNSLIPCYLCTCI